MPRLTTLTLALLVACWPATSQALEPTRPSEVVTLTTSGGGECLSAGQTRLINQILFDGTVAPFAIRRNEVLVVTGVSWNLSFQSPNGNVPIAIASQTDASTVQARFFTGALADAVGNSTGSALVPNVVLNVTQFLPCVNFPQGQSGGIFVHGFVQPNK
jgi:hypothetical protein